ncbi:saccharopine dehydrogenase family protein [Aestuariirhabdus litorea]|uniref:Saccharopine dehydrogenase n=1 Tax=Aestuariirhabdus litorea TaxID=2528527 RepID=A0A3P3VKI3_9GAMM|nr:DUF5938 domain-containing protein [Aestuariirhabdus litorea]RRJ83210.1 saccharopine dehydrogenase [Aestuariirhabdus litorea]RWW93367.1 saccharopine dehydrogenase [Endozoicomonadaceae bacterium GTF-13]
MSQTPRILIYGASGYTGKLVAESLAERNIPFFFVGRNRERLEAALAVVNQRLGREAQAQIAVASNTAEELMPLFTQVDVVINVAGPFMQLAWPVVECCLEAGCHYLDTTGEQDWVLAIKQQYGEAFAAKQLLLSPANAYMWAAGALAAEVVLENEGVDTLDLIYQIDNGLPSEASTKSFLRMQCNETSQYYLEQNEFKAWPNDQAYQVVVPYRAQPYRALPWGGACEPVWYADHPRVRNCSVLTAIGEHIVDGVLEAIGQFNALSQGMTQEQKEQLTNQIGDQINTGEPPKDDVDVQRSLVVCYGRGRTLTTQFVLNLSAPYSWTGEVCAEAAQRLLEGRVERVGFQSVATAFDYRDLLRCFHAKGYCNLPPVGVSA